MEDDLKKESQGRRKRRKARVGRIKKHVGNKWGYDG
jgi:hypothetical protein